MRTGDVIGADDPSAWKARILLALALTRTVDPAEIRRMFAIYRAIAFSLAPRPILV